MIDDPEVASWLEGLCREFYWLVAEEQRIASRRSSGKEPEMPKCMCQHDLHFEKEGPLDLHRYQAEVPFVLRFHCGSWMQPGQTMDKCFWCLSEHTMITEDCDILKIIL